jgi:hypothetical protein
MSTSREVSQELRTAGGSSVSGHWRLATGYWLLVRRGAAEDANFAENESIERKSLAAARRRSAESQSAKVEEPGGTLTATRRRTSMHRNPFVLPCPAPPLLVQAPLRTSSVFISLAVPPCRRESIPLVLCIHTVVVTLQFSSADPFGLRAGRVEDKRSTRRRELVSVSSGPGAAIMSDSK